MRIMAGPSPVNRAKPGTRETARPTSSSPPTRKSRGRPRRRAYHAADGLRLRPQPDPSLAFFSVCASICSRLTSASARHIESHTAAKLYSSTAHSSSTAWRLEQGREQHPMLQGLERGGVNNKATGEATRRGHLHLYMRHGRTCPRSGMAARRSVCLHEPTSPLIGCDPD